MPAYRDLAFPTTREAALAHARHFAPHMGGDYAKNRNSVVPGHAFVSRLAPALRVRLISEKEVEHIALDEFQELRECEKFLQEVHWRSYWRSWLELRPDVWQHYRQSLLTSERHLDAQQRRRVWQIENSESGVTPIDEFASELVCTGYMHNHARMWFAAYWIHAEGLPWELGADFFARHLVCACPASNTLSWRWVAGLHTRGKAYLARRSNLEKYCDPAYLGDLQGMERLENPTPVSIPDEELVSIQHPEFDLELKAPQGKIGLWITEDDLSPETSQLHDAQIAAIGTSIVGAPPVSNRSNGKRRAYRMAAMQDATTRAQHHWSSEAQTLDGDAELTAELTGWAKRHSLSTIVALKPFVGPTHDALNDAQHHLKSVGIELKLLRREHDARLLSHAKRGFFNFWEMYKKRDLNS